MKKCFEYVGLNYKKFIKIDKKLFRPSKTRNLLADISKAKKDLKFNLKTDLDGLIKIMMDERGWHNGLLLDQLKISFKIILR